MKKLAVVIVCALLAGCAAKTDEELFAEAIESQKAGDFEDAVETYTEVMTAHPQSPRVPEALYAIGAIYQDQLRDFPKAIESYQKLVDNYPTHGTTPNALFLVGFINHNELKNIDAARTAYEAFLRKFPESSLVSSAQFELDHLGQDPAQILEDRTAAQAGAPETKARAK